MGQTRASGRSTYHVADSRRIDWELWELPGSARRMLQAASIWLPMNGVKMLYMSVGVIRAWALSDVQVKCMSICWLKS